MLSGAISLGFSYLIFSVFFLMQPWLYFTQANTGHKQGCPVPVVFFGTFDMYNIHWQRFLKASAVIGVVGTVPYAIFGLGMIIHGVYHHDARARALKILNDRADKEVDQAKKEAHTLKDLREQLEREAQRERAEPASTDLDRNIERTHEQQLKALEGAEKMRELKKEIQESIAKRKENRRIMWAVRIVHTIIFAAAGALSIYFIERTLQLNDVDLEDDLITSSGQMLSLLVAVFTTFGFGWEALRNKREAARRRKELDGALWRALDSIGSLITSFQDSFFKSQGTAIAGLANLKIGGVGRGMWRKC